MTSRSIPGAVSGGLNFTALSSSVTPGGYYTCGLTTTGSVYCWGRNITIRGNWTVASTPVLVLGGLTFATVTVGAFVICGLATSGTAYCWGDNYYGELGDGTTNDSPAPVAVSIP